MPVGVARARSSGCAGCGAELLLCQELSSPSGLSWLALYSGAANHAPADGPRRVIARRDHRRPDLERAHELVGVFHGQPIVAKRTITTNRPAATASLWSRAQNNNAVSVRATLRPCRRRRIQSLSSPRTYAAIRANMSTWRRRNRCALSTWFWVEGATVPRTARELRTRVTRGRPARRDGACRGRGCTGGFIRLKPSRCCAAVAKAGGLSDAVEELGRARGDRLGCCSTS